MSSTNRILRDDKRTLLAFGAALLAVFVYLVLRNRGALPMVFADEWLYSQFARLRPLAESTLPSYLYLELFGASSACGVGFLGCVRFGNTLLFLLSAPFIYLVARPVTGRNAAVAVALASMLGAVNSYTAYFMPEAMYFMCFWVLSWAVLNEIGGTGLRGGLVAGVLLGLMTLVKVHALFLLPALLVFALWRGWRDHNRVDSVLYAVTMTVVMLAVKYALGWLLAGAAGLDLLGSFYGAHANNKSSGTLLRLLAPALWNFYGHAMALVLLFALPLLAFAAAFAGPAASPSQPGGRQLRAALVYAVLTLGAALGMTVAYTASIADAGPLEGVRLHLRYYNFVFPLLLIAAASPLLSQELPRRRRLAMALVAIALLVYSALQLRPTFQLSFADNPELSSMVGDNDVYNLLLLAQLVAILGWLRRPHLGRALFLWLLLPAFVIAAERATIMRLAEARVPNTYDHAGVAALQALTPQQRDRLLIVGDEGAGLPRALFHVDRAATQIMPLPPGAPLEASLIPRGIEHLMVVGQHALPPELAPQTATPEYTLTHLPPSRVVQQVVFALPERDDTLSGFEGLFEREPWGSWSNGKRVVLHFTRALPRQMTVFLNASAFGPNAGQEFKLQVGEQQRRFKLSGQLSEHLFRLDSDGQQHTLVIEIPQPVSPQQLGQGGDIRELGMALIYLEVGEVVTPATRN